MSQPIICPLCSTPNSPSQIYCSVCAALLPATSIDTKEVKPDLPFSPFISRDNIYSKLLPDTLGLLIVGESKPKIWESPKRVLLGRFDTPDGAWFDLTPYGARDKGVSRLHAQISRTASGYELKDMGSTNGTWVNAHHLGVEQLITLRNGDLVRLGRIAIYIYFRL